MENMFTFKVISGETLNGDWLNSEQLFPYFDMGEAQLLSLLCQRKIIVVFELRKRKIK